MSVKIILLSAFSVQVLSYAVYTAVPEISVPEIEYYGFHFFLLEIIKHFLVVVVADDCVLVDRQHVDVKYSFFHVSDPVLQPGVDEFYQLVVMFFALQPPLSTYFGFDI